MEFSDEIDRYVVLKLPLDRFRAAERAPDPDLCITSKRPGRSLRRDEQRCLKNNFRRWPLPYWGLLNGWRADSLVYAVHEGRLVGGAYLCENNEFGEPGWGQVHYVFVDEPYRGRGIYSALFREVVLKARRWGLAGVILNPDRHLLPEMYVRWGARVWKQVGKEKRSRSPFALAGRALRLAALAVRAAFRRLSPPRS